MNDVANGGVTRKHNDGIAFFLFLECASALGMEKNVIPNSAISASSEVIRSSIETLKEIGPTLPSQTITQQRNKRQKHGCLCVLLDY